ncbi:MAG: hypothetical protein VX495_00570 [Nitrospinota bacterium]|nr:hypothetical protein [Nitrospinota bacterium]
MGKKRHLMLLKQFGNLENIQKAPLVELISLPGITKSLAEKIQSLSK